MKTPKGKYAWTATSSGMKALLELGMYILSVLLRSLSVLNCCLRAIVEASETHYATLFSPDGFFIPDFDSRDGTVTGTETTSYAGILNFEVIRFSHSIVFNRVDYLRQ